MKLKPNSRNEKENDAAKKRIDAITYKIAIVISAISVYYFFIKILFL
jgi:hypothetical protein